jgi:hypothetical protein
VAWGPASVEHQVIAKPNSACSFDGERRRCRFVLRQAKGHYGGLAIDLLETAGWLRAVLDDWADAGMVP